jgi:formylmethanofuran dehydrogenase subunit E
MPRSLLSITAAVAIIIIYLAWAPGAERAPVRAVVDTDMGLDDVRAVLALLADPSVEVRAFVSIEGSASLGKGTDNLIGLLEEIGPEGAMILSGRRYPEREPPQWRETANSLAGHPFPPPRRRAAMDEAARRTADLMESSVGRLHYLALGPLGNLALLEQHEPGSLGRLAAIWIPVSISSGDLVDAWNLSYDPRSTISVMSSAREVVFVDIAGPSPWPDPAEILSRLRGRSPAARWIEEIRSSAHAHLALCDELAALAVIRPDMILISPGRFSLRVESNGSMRLEACADGPVRVARFIDPEEAIGELVRLWESGTSAPQTRDGAGPISPGHYIRAFHGHLGPYLVLGYRMGRIALRELDSPGHFGLSAVVSSLLTPPQSCLIDGIQLGSGCTLGKRNIEVRATDGPAYAVFRSDLGDEVTIELKAELPELIGRLTAESGVETAGTALMEMDENDLFEIIRQVSPPAP